MVQVLRRFFVVVIVSIAAAAGHRRAPAAAGAAAAQAPPGWHAMAGLGIVMMLLFGHIFFAPWRRLQRAVAAQDWPEGGKRMNQIALLVKINLGLGWVAIAASCRAWRWGRLRYPLRPVHVRWASRSESHHDAAPATMRAMSDNIPALPCWLNGEMGPCATPRSACSTAASSSATASTRSCRCTAASLFRFDEHMARLDRSLAELRIAQSADAPRRSGSTSLIAARRGTGRAAGATDQLVYIQVTRGVALRDHVMPPDIDADGLHDGQPP